MPTRTLAALALLTLVSGAAWAQAPNVMTYQGRLQESGVPVAGTRMVEVRLCDQLAAGTCYPAAGTAAQGVTVLNGVFKTTFSIPSGVNLAVGGWFMEVAVGQSVLTLNTLSPRERLTSFPYAVYASSAAKLLGTVLPSQVVAGALDTTVIAQGFYSGSILTASLADGAVNSSKLALGGVDTGRLATDAVDSSKILDGAVQTLKLAVDAVDSTKILDGAVQTSKLAVDAVTTAKILDAAVQTSKIAPGAVDTFKIADGSVTNPKLLDAAVTTFKIAAGSVDSNRLANFSVLNLKLAPSCVDTSKMLPDAIINSAILNGSVDTRKLAPAAVSTSKLAVDAVTAYSILDGSVGTTKISLGAVDTGRLADNAVTNDKLAAGILLRGDIGMDRAGAMTRMGTATGSSLVTLTVPARKHLEVFIHIPGLANATDVRLQMNGLTVGSYAVTRSTGGYSYTDVAAAGIDLLGVAGMFPLGTQIEIRLILEGNSGVPSLISGVYQASAFRGTAFAPVAMQGAFGVNVAGSPVTSISVFGLTASLPVGTYLVAYGEDIP